MGPPPSAPTSSRSASSGGSGRSRSARSTWLTGAEWLDVVGLGLLIGLALYGFQSAYGGTRYLIAGLVGTLLGLAVAMWGARTRQPLIVVTAATLGVFFLFGGAVAVPDEAIAGIFPSPGSVVALVDGAISGWARLLTVNPPVGTGFNLLVVPYLCGLTAAVVSLTIARRTRWGQLALVPPFVVLALSILFGAPLPASLLLQGAAFAVVAIGWVSFHRRASRRAAVAAGRNSRLPAALAVLALAGVAGVLVGGTIPGAGTRPRVVLRDRTEPPFDPRNHPSPLSSFRRYEGDDNSDKKMRDAVLFQVTGLKGDERVRLATMDGYDGQVFTVGSGQGSSGWFQRVSQEIPHPDEGERRTVTVKVDGYTDIWLPGAGYIERVEFDGPRAEELQSEFRYNTSTGIGASNIRMAKGDAYTMDVLLPPQAPSSGKADKIDQPAVQALPAAAAKAEAWVDAAGDAKGNASAVERIRDVIVGEHINTEGATSDDRGGASGGVARPGHHWGRLNDMVKEDGLMLGDGEQYAPLVALMARDLGIPARVVMGFVVPKGHSDPAKPVSIKGGDVSAWVEIAIDGKGWVPITNIDPKNENPQRKTPTQKNQAEPPPPPPPTIPPTEDDDVDSNKVDPCAVDSKGESSKGDAAKGDAAKEASANGAAGVTDGETAGAADCTTDEEGGGSRILGIVLTVGGVAMLPFAVIGAITAAIAGLKARRRNQRRRTGPPSTRVAGGWHEVIDLAADMGSPIPVLATRSEGARLMGTDAAVGLARYADVGIFGPTSLTDDWVATYWNDVDATRAAMTADMSKVERWRVLVSLASLRSSFDRWRMGMRRGRGSEDQEGSAQGDAVVAGSVPSSSFSGGRPTEATSGAGAGWYQGEVDSVTGAGIPTTTGRHPTGPGRTDDASGGSWWRDDQL